MPRKSQPPIDGALVIDKPSGKTSHDVVEAVRRLLGFRQIGHLGTLDPLATGVLVLLLGRATRLAQFYSGRRKSYTCAVRFGFATDTYDADGRPLGPDLSPSLDAEMLRRFAAESIGHISQTPPPFSAKKINGRAAHELARKNQPVALKPVEVDVYEFLLSAVEGSIARFSVECGAGTYIRSLAHELGKREGSGAHLAEITRTSVGEFSLDQAISLDEFAAAVRAGRVSELVIRLEHLLPELPRASVLPFVERRVRHGAKFNLPVSQIQPGHSITLQNSAHEMDSSNWKPACIRVFNSQERLIAIAQSVVPRTYQPIVVLEAEP